MAEGQLVAPEEIFKAYDIRGLYGSQMDESTAYAVGRAFARVLGGLRDKPTNELRIGLGRDYMRLQAPGMAGRLRDGLVDEGATVLDAGMVGTEMLYFLVGSQELDGGAMVTASHNPKAYTGTAGARGGAGPLWRGGDRRDRRWWPTDSARLRAVARRRRSTSTTPSKSTRSR